MPPGTAASTSLCTQCCVRSACFRLSEVSSELRTIYSSNRISKLHSSFNVLSELQLSLVQADLVVGEICGVNENRTVNPAVDHCCKANFAFRRPCFEALGADKTYVPPSTSQGLFTFHTDLCQAHNEELQRKKDRY